MRLKMNTTDWESVRAAFRKIWGYSDFRSPQGEIIRCLLSQRDAVIVMPTGGGKSICFQLPALLQSGLTLVISPLVALMENQVLELRDRRLPAALLHSEVPSQQRQQTLRAIDRQTLRLLYLSPETLLTTPVWERLSQPEVRINGLILDEAHCLVQWGETFRPTYYRLGAVRSWLLKGKPKDTRIAVAAFTATADPQAQQTIQRILQLRSPQMFQLSPYRANLHLNVRVVWTPRGRRQQLAQFIQARTGEAGLVYVRTRRDTEDLATFLTTQGHSTAAYHAGLSPEERRAIEAAWLTGETQFVICTSAFGMGINKANCRWIVHFHAPSLLSEYVQEVGRAGRDGERSDALMLVSEPTGLLDPEDKQRHQFFTEKIQQQRREAQELVKKLPTQGDVSAVCRQFKGAALALAWLHGTGQLVWNGPFHYALKLSQPAQGTQGNEDAAKQMIQYVRTRDCRWQVLLRSFGFSQEAQVMRCGHCDNCRG